MKIRWILVIVVLVGLVVWANAQVKKEKIEPAQPVQPILEQPKKVDKPGLKSPPAIEPTAETGKGVDKPRLDRVSPVSPVPETGIGFEKKPRLEATSFIGPIQEVVLQYRPLSLREMDPVQGVDGISYQVREFNDFKGGLDLVSVKTRVAPNSAIELENVLWNPQGELEKRPGYSEHSTPPEVLNFLYAYYNQIGDKWTMGGSDTALYYLHEDSSNWTYLIGTGGTSGRWDGTTFEDMFVGTHEGITPVVWNGSTFVTMGTSIDSFEMHAGYASNLSSPCYICSTRVFLEEDQGFDAGDFVGYTLLFTADTLYGAGQGWVKKKAIIIGNSSQWIYLRHLNWEPSGYISPSAYIASPYAQILSWFQVDTVWRSGTLDSATQITTDSYGEWVTKAWADTFYWDSTFQYDDYIFEVITGEGEGKKIFLANWNGACRSALGVGWDTLAFIIQGYGSDCFDSTTEYRIYKPSFWEGSKFCANAFGSLWLGWTGIGDEQNKNIVVWSETDDLGNWPSGNYIIIESDDGDFITGMAKFPGEYTDVPRGELEVFKNNSFYKIVPSGDAYDFWLITSGVGCVSNSAISPAEGKYLIFPDQHGVWAYDKRKPFSISGKIKPIFEGWNLEALESASGIYNPQDRHYYLSYPDTQMSEDSLTYGVVVWYDDRDEALGWDIYGQRFNYLGELVDTNFRINDDTTSGAEMEPSIAFTWSNTFLVTWGGGDDVKDDIHIREFNADGQPLGASFRVNEDSTQDTAYSSMPAIAVHLSGKYVVTWERHFPCPPCTTDVRFQRFDSSGNQVGANSMVNDGVGKFAYEPRVGYSANGNFIICWITGGADDKCYFQRFDSSGSPIGANVLVDDSTGVAPDLIVNDDGSFVVFYDADAVGTINYVFGQRYDSSGTKIGSRFQLNDDATAKAKEYQSADYMPNDDFVVAWTDFRETLGEPYAQRYSSNGSAIGSNQILYDDSADCKNPSLVVDNEGRTVVVWNEFTVYADSDWVRVYGRISKPYSWTSATGCGRIRISYGGGATEVPDVDLNPLVELQSDVNNKTLAWSLDFGGWSRESFDASAYCYQHSLSDDVKILFADPEQASVYNYGTQGDDLTDPVILTYQTPYLGFGEYPSFDYEMRYATVEAFLDTGNVYLTWYKNYSDSTYYDSLICGSDCREQIELPEDLWGKNISMKLKTGSGIDNFTLSRFWWEWTVDQNRK